VPGTDNTKLQETAGDLYCQSIVNDILAKLRDDPRSLTTEDARRLSENAVAGDMRTAKIISAVEAFAVASEVIHDIDPRLGQAPHTSLNTLINDLKIAVEQNPTDVTPEVLRTAQNVVSSKCTTLSLCRDVTRTDCYTEMQRAVGHTNAPHPELEAELQEEIAKIEPKVAEGTVTIEEANHLHSLEARAHGHTEKGGITSIAQSVAAKRERQLSLSSGSSPISNRSRTNSKAFTAQEQSHRDKEANLHAVQDAPRREAEQGTTEKAGQENESPKHRVNGHVDKDGTASQAPTTAHKREMSQPAVEVN
jgi:hypothetical protein